MENEKKYDNIEEYLDSKQPLYDRLGPYGAMQRAFDRGCLEHRALNGPFPGRKKRPAVDKSVKNDAA